MPLSDLLYALAESLTRAETEIHAEFCSGPWEGCRRHKGPLALAAEARAQVRELEGGAQ